MPPDNTARGQLERVLYILPAAARDGGAALEELARALDVEAATVLTDIEHVTARAYYHPAGTVDKFSIAIERGHVKVHAPTEFQRPVRLNDREALALGLGLRALAADAEPARRREIIEFARRVEADLSAPTVVTVHEARDARDVPDKRYMRDLPDVHDLHSRDAYDSPDIDVEHHLLGFDDDGFRGVVMDAIELGRLCTIWYLKPGDAAPAYRSIAPYRLLYAEGNWYLAAYDTDREALRFFRMDRVLDAALEDEPAPTVPLSQDDLAAFLANGAPYMAADDVEVRVRYSPRVARWVAERTVTYPGEDGSVTVSHRVADPRWIVRHVLKYGGEAVVEEPPIAREWVAAAALDVAAPTSE